MDDPQLTTLVVTIVEYYQEMTQYIELRVYRDLFKDNVKMLVLKRLAEWRQRRQKELKEIGEKGHHQKVLEKCRVYRSLKDGINRTEHRTDLEVKPADE